MIEKINVLTGGRNNNCTVQQSNNSSMDTTCCTAASISVGAEQCKIKSFVEKYVSLDI